MRIAVTYADGEIFQHFGHTQQFKIYEVESGNVVSSQVIDTTGSGHGALAALLGSLNVNMLICGGIGGGAQIALAEAGVVVYGGVCGDADLAVADFLAGNLAYNPDIRCTHHDHACGGHSCGSHCGHHCGGHE